MKPKLVIFSGAKNFRSSSDLLLEPLFSLYLRATLVQCNPNQRRISDEASHSFLINVIQPVSAGDGVRLLLEDPKDGARVPTTLAS